MSRRMMLVSSRKETSQALHGLSGLRYFLSGICFTYSQPGAVNRTACDQARSSELVQCALPAQCSRQLSIVLEYPLPVVVGFNE